MPQTRKKPAQQPPGANAAPTDVLTLAEAAAYLRVQEEDLLRLLSEQGLPGRQIGQDWRFLRAALQDWLRTPQSAPGGKDFWQTQLGAFEDDPHLEDMLREIYKRRGRAMTEES
jgi:excisionase family DNA binding protein